MEIKTVQYGSAIFSCVCPVCGERVLRAPKDLDVNKYMMQFFKKKPATIPSRCKNCGKVNLPLVGFEKDTE